MQDPQPNIGMHMRHHMGQEVEHGAQEKDARHNGEDTWIAGIARGDELSEISVAEVVGGKIQIPDCVSVLVAQPLRLWGEFALDAEGGVGVG